MSQLTIATHITADDRRAVLELDARSGLTSTPKRLAPIWFYDERGSALFDEITRLPEYYPTRSERGLLVAAADEIARRSGAEVLVELGSGTSEKSRILLDALDPERYVPLDVDPDTLAATADQLTIEYPDLEIHAVAADFLRHLGHLPDGGCRLVAFLGSTVGNLTPPERHRFFTDVEGILSPSDHLLLGVDLVKDVARLVAAYDDAAGVTAEFNRNALRVVNRELDADFDVDAFEHVARWVPADSRIEMHLRAGSAQEVRVGDLDLVVRVEPGEEIRTEISTKFTEEGIRGELEAAGLVVDRTWRAGEDEFLLVLAHPRR